MTKHEGKGMFAIERQRMIKQLLNQNKHVSVAELSCCLNVSEVTIRRDLEKLEGERFLMRTHGGAVLLDPDSGEPAAQVDDGVLSAEDGIDEISDLAVSMIADNDIIYLGSGMVSDAIAQRLSGKRNLIVLTCSLPVAAELYKNRDLQVIIPGGAVSPTGLLFGEGVQESLDTMHVAKAFIEVEGFNASGFTTRDQALCLLARRIGKISDHVVFLCPPQSYGSISFYNIGALSLADSIVTTAEINDSFKEACAEKHVKLFTAYGL